MLGQMLTELTKIDEWLDKRDSGLRHSCTTARDWQRIATVVELCGDAVSQHLLYMEHQPGHPSAITYEQTVRDLGDVAINAMLAMLHFTKDTATTGAILLERLRVAERQMLNDSVMARRNAVRESADALAAQRALNESLNT